MTDGPTAHRAGRPAAVGALVPALDPPARAGAPALYDVDPDRVARLVLTCPAVTGMSGGPSGTAATYLPGRKVPGVRLGAESVEVHVTVRYGVTVAEVVDQIRQVLAGQVGPGRVDIVVEDVSEPAEPASASPVSGRSPVVAPASA